MSEKIKYATALEKECNEKMVLVNMIKKNSTNPNINHQKQIVAQCEKQTLIAKNAAFPIELSDYGIDEFSLQSPNLNIYIAQNTN